MLKWLWRRFRGDSAVPPPPQPSAAPAEALAGDPGAIVPPPPDSGKRVLVVEDEPRIVELIRKHLQRQGHAVETATNGLEGLAKIRHTRPDLVISDSLMPEMDGVELLAAAAPTLLWPTCRLC